jgi:catechol 2,3-dioxygenase-like lactoylglutathione lyase family enzyme
MDKIDHIALQVDDVKKSVEYYTSNYDCSIIFEDDTWAFLQFDNIKLALIIEDQHPHHIGFAVDELKCADHITEHRDGSWSKYVQDPSGNNIELIKYKKDKGN